MGANEGVSKSPLVRTRERARALGFDAVGVARADVPLGADFERYRAFLDAGMHGAMGYLADNAEVRRRLDTRFVLEGARSVVCLARRYQRRPEEEARDPETARTIARYARGRDYHNVVRRKVRQLAAFIRALGAPDRPVHARPLCDDAPVLERVWAARAGLGFVGKNGLLIVPGQGSFVLLGEVVTTLDLEPDAPMTERCGSCTRCLDACPTQAFERPFVLDPRRCIAYLTIELREGIPASLREPLGEHLFGCDDCQTVCPFNASARPRDARSRAFEPLPRWADMTLESIVALDEDGWAAVREGTPLARPGRDGLARNAAIVLGNRGDGRAAVALRRAAVKDPSPVVREAAAWALAKIEGDREAR
jgi:epoxyqueuosine reductase